MCVRERVCCGGVRVEEVNSTPRGRVSCFSKWHHSLPVVSLWWLVFTLGTADGVITVSSSRKWHCTTGSPNWNSSSGLPLLTSDSLIFLLFVLWPFSHSRRMCRISGTLTSAMWCCIMSPVLIVAAGRLSATVIAAPAAVCLSVYVHVGSAAGVQELQEEIGSCEWTASTYSLSACGRKPGLVP